MRFFHRCGLGVVCGLHFFAVLTFCGLANGQQSSANIALGKKYTLSPAPNYQYCTDLGDTVQLTDGKKTKDYFWTQRGTVGWNGVPYVVITIDLGRIEPIGGVAFRTAAGVAGVLWPDAIHVLASEDGKSYRDLGDLVASDLRTHGPWPKGYAIRQLSAMDLRGRGRYVRFVAIAGGSPFIFCDEIEIYRGPAALLEGAALGTPAPGGIEQFFVQARCQQRYERDIAAIGRAIDSAEGVAADVRRALREQWKLAAEALRAAPPLDDPTLRSGMPYNAAHARLFQTQAALWKALGRADLSCDAPCPWDSTSLTALPPTLARRLEVHAMRGEYRAAAVNLYNASQRPIEAAVHFEGLPGGATPDYVSVHEGVWTDTSTGQPVVAALPLARREGGAWRVTVLPGLVRQVWLTFHADKLAAGNYVGHFVVEGSKAESLQVPVVLKIYPIDFPKQTTLLLGGWSYTDRVGSFGVTAANRAALVAHLQEHFVNSPWATAGVMPVGRFDADGKMTPPDTKNMDAWLAQWPDAKMVMVFLSFESRKEFGGAALGTPEFDRRVGAWISAWVRHLGTKGIAPERLGLLIHDEPNEGTKTIEPFLAFARAIRAAEPKVCLWEDPTYDKPRQAPAALFAACDVLCPNRPMWLAHDKTFADFYRGQQRQGRTLNFYSCSGPAQLLDPYSYYRLQAWHCWRIGATASFFWAFGDCGASSWNAYLARSGGPYSPEFLDKTSVTPAKQMEAIRESVEDYECFVMLDKAIKKAETAGRHDATVARAKKLLTAGVENVLTSPDAEKIHWTAAKDRMKADAVRVEILETLSQLQP